MYGMDDKHLAKLIKLYQEVDTPSDSLIQDEDKLHTFCYRFEERVGVAYKPKTIARALLMGAQAGVIGWGQPWKRLERNFDYLRKPGTATDGIYATSKVRFRDPGAGQNVNTAQEDFAVWAVDTAVEEA